MYSRFSSDSYPSFGLLPATVGEFSYVSHRVAFVPVHHHISKGFGINLLDYRAESLIFMHRLGEPENIPKAVLLILSQADDSDEVWLRKGRRIVYNIEKYRVFKDLERNHSFVRSVHTFL